MKEHSIDIDDNNRMMKRCYDNSNDNSGKELRNFSNNNNFSQMNPSLDLSTTMMISNTSNSLPNATSAPKTRCKFLVAMEAAVSHINSLPQNSSFEENSPELPSPG